MRNIRFAKKRKQIHTTCFLLCMLVMIIDQASKFHAINNLNTYEVFQVFPCVNFILSFNKGISFSMFDSSSSIFIIGISIFCISLLIWAYLRFNDSIERLFLSLIIGGAICNIIDRFAHGAVVDFIDVYIPSSMLSRVNSYIQIFSSQVIFSDWHFPTFNIADSFITVSTIGLIFYNLFKKNS